MMRRRILMARKNAEQNIFVTGNAGSSGSTIIAEVLDGNILSITSYPRGSGRIIMRFKYPISVEQGDIFKIVCTKQSGDINRTTAIRLGINTSYIQDPGVYVSLNDGFTVDYTVTANASFTQLFLANMSSTITGTNYKALFEIYKNGVKMI